MTVLSDPGKGKQLAATKADRMKAWKKPALKKDADALRVQRIAAWEESINGNHLQGS